MKLGATVLIHSQQLGLQTGCTQLCQQDLIRLKLANTKVSLETIGQASETGWLKEMCRDTVHLLNLF